MRDVKEPEVRRAEIMDAAIRLFAVKGYLNTTTQDIIDEVNISRGLLYYHFKNKEDILYCIIDRFSNPLLERLERLSFQGEGDAIDKVRAFINTTMIPEQNVTTESSVLQDAINLEENRYLLDRFYHKLSGRMTECFSHIIEQGNQEGVFHVAAPMETAAFLMTGYIFVSNDAKLACQTSEQLMRFMDAYSVLLERSLSVSNPIFSKD